MTINEYNAENFSANQNDGRYNTITTLPIQFQERGEDNGYRFTRTYKTDRAFINEVYSVYVIHYGLFKRIINKRFACENYPRSNAFGIWTCMTLVYAIEKFNELTING